MKILLDECLPARLKALIKGHEVSTVQEMGWGGKKNGELLSRVKGLQYISDIRSQLVLSTESEKIFHHNRGSARQIECLR